MHYRKCLTLWLLLFVCHKLAAQSGAPQYAYDVGIRIFRGAIIKHNSSVGHLAISRPQGFAVFFNRHTFGKKYCESLYQYPDVSYSLTYIDYLNPILGKSLSLGSQLSIPAKHFPQGKLSFKIGTGLAYHTRPHHPTYNNSNTALGTPVTLSLLTGFTYARQLSSLWSTALSLSFTHFSNGSFSKPNAGINLPSLDLEISRQLKAVTTEKEQTAHQNKQAAGIHYYMGLSSGIKELEYGGDKFSFVNLHFLASKQLNSLSAINLGLDAFFDSSLKAFIETEIPEARPDYRRIGLVGGHELFYERLSMLTQIGAYLYRPFKGKYSSFYQRYGLRYAWTDHFITSFSLKAHAGQAEFIEWGIGIKF